MTEDIHLYPDEDNIDGVANLRSDSKMSPHDGKSRDSLASVAGMMLGKKLVRGQRAQVTVAMQEQLIRERTAHQRAACWRCGSKDVGYDFAQGHYYCAHHKW